LPRTVGLPYSQAWYQEYLRTHGLPSYFLRPRHLSMLLDDDESTHLGLSNAPSSQVAMPLPLDYLERRFPEEPLWPEPGNSIYQRDGLSKARRANLVRHFPALAVTKFPYNIFIFPEGIIGLGLPGEVNDFPTVSEADVEWYEGSQGTIMPSSYHQESTGLHLLSLANLPSDREAPIQLEINHHAIVNPMEDIPGLGELIFLSDWDRQEAARRGYATPHDVSTARRRGDLAVGTGINAGPIVVFRPAREFLNPVEQPAGPGAWRFLTSAGDTSNASLADIQFGGTRGLPRYPSARQIRHLGQLFIQEGRTNLAAEIDLVWVPGAEDVEDEEDPTLDSELDAQDDDDEQDQQEPQTPPANVPINCPSPRHNPDGLTVDPTNNGGVRGGVHDQTAEGKWVEYQTMRRHGGRIITIDRSRAWHNYPQPHKMWCYSHRGWRKWLHADDMDWADKRKVEHLNKHRDQTHNRADWPRLRVVKRQDYTRAELEFVMERIKAAGGNRPMMDMEKLAAEFHRRFPLRAHSDTGLQSLTDRLRVEYEKFKGLKPRKKRGWSQHEGSKAARGAAQAAKSETRVDSESQEPGEGHDEDQEQGEEQDETEYQSGEGEDDAQVDGDAEAEDVEEGNEAEESHDAE
jgi:hypothetical protein